MSDSDSTLEQSTQEDKVLQAIAALSAKFDKFERETSAQFEAIREGISHNASRFDRMDAHIYQLRAEIANLKADLRDLNSSSRTGNLSLK